MQIVKQRDASFLPIHFSRKHKRRVRKVSRRNFSIDRDESDQPMLFSLIFFQACRTSVFLNRANFEMTNANSRYAYFIPFSNLYDLPKLIRSYKSVVFIPLLVFFLFCNIIDINIFISSKEIIF